jgi:hypothetical protein
MFIETVPNRTSPPAVLLRESFRDEQGRAQKRTLANLSKLPDDVIDGLRWCERKNRRVEIHQTLIFRH